MVKIKDKNFIDSTHFHEQGNTIYERIEITIWAEILLNSEASSFDLISIVSEVHVDLGEEYSGVTLENEIEDILRKWYPRKWYPRKWYPRKWYLVPPDLCRKKQKR